MTSLIPRKTRDSKGSAAAAIPASDAAGAPPAGANPNLPEGYDVEGGDYFVPERLRDMYQVDEEAEMRAVRSSGIALTMIDGQPLQGLYAGPLTMVRQRWVDARYAEVMADPERFRDIRAFFRAGPDATPKERWDSLRSVRARDLDTTWPDTYRAEDERIWVHWWRVMNAEQQRANAVKTAAGRERWTREHTCSSCPTEAAEVEQRDVHGAKIRCCRACSILLAAAAVQQLSTQRVGDKTRGEWVAEYLRRQQPGQR
jgi:hypothetical protein